MIGEAIDLLQTNSEMFGPFVHNVQRGINLYIFPLIFAFSI